MRFNRPEGRLQGFPGGFSAFPSAGVVERHAVLPGTNGNMFDSSDAGRPTGTVFTIVFRVTYDSYGTSAIPCSCYNLTGPQRLWINEILNDDTWRFGATADGTSGFSNVKTTTSSPGYTDATEVIVRCRLNWDNGSSQRVGNHETWDGGSWTTPSGSQTLSGAVDLWDSSTVPTVIGGWLNNTTYTAGISGTVKRIKMWEALVTDNTTDPFTSAASEGSVLWDFDPNDYSGSGSSWTSKTGETWNILGTASVVED